MYKESKDTSVIPNVSDPEYYKREKFIALYQARKILSKIGSMEERRVCGKQLKRMQTNSN